jgi:drug/metabolite transporter (DMT)-like permease
MKIFNGSLNWGIFLIIFGVYVFYGWKSVWNIVLGIIIFLIGVVRLVKYINTRRNKKNAKA